MKAIFRFLFAGVAAVSSSQICLADMCDDFKGSVSLAASVPAISLTAGQIISIPVQVSIDASEAKKWQWIYMSAGAYNGIAGSRSMYENYIIKSKGEVLEIPKTLSVQSYPNMGGNYKLGASIYAQDKSFPGACVVQFDPVPDFKIEIKNDPKKIDIFPPVLKDIRFKKPSYESGDTLEILFQAQLKNEICTVWKAQNEKCEFGTHVELKAIDGEDTVSFHTPTPIFKTKEKDILLALVPLSEEYATGKIKAGRYRLSHLMVKDLFGNFFDEVPASPEIVVELR